MTGLLKNFLDRTCAIWPHLEGKSLAVWRWRKEGIGQAIQNIKSYGTFAA